MTAEPTTLNTYGLGKEQLLEIDYYLRLTRSLEERIVALFRQAKVIGGIYRSLGQEGESVAAAYALDYKQGDVVQPLIRNLGSILVAGAKPADVLRQYMAKGDSPTRGRDGNHRHGTLSAFLLLGTGGNGQRRQRDAKNRQRCATGEVSQSDHRSHKDFRGFHECITCKPFNVFGSFGERYWGDEESARRLDGLTA